MGLAQSSFGVQLKLEVSPAQGIQARLEESASLE